MRLINIVIIMFTLKVLVLFTLIISLSNITMERLDKIEKELSEAKLRVRVLTILNKENASRRAEKRRKEGEMVARYKLII